jgi:AAA15 family ATPase/GTPase
MVAADLKRPEDSERGIIEVPLDGSDEPLKLLRTVGIFGPNASGKSTVLLASHALRWLVKNSSQRNKPGDTIPPYEPFKLDKDSKKSPVTLGCQVTFGGSLLKYEISYRADAIETEILTMLGADGICTLIERTPGGEIKGGLIEKSSANQLYVKGMQPNVSVLSKLAQHGPSEGEDSAKPYYQAILDATSYEDYSNSSLMHYPYSPSDRFADEDDFRNWIMSNLILRADVGIKSAEVRKDDVVVPDVIKKLAAELDNFKIPAKQVNISFLHEGTDVQPIDFSDESSGTRKLFNIAGDWWRLAHEEITLLADELSASLHPRLLDTIVRAVNDVPRNQKRSQLIFSTHDVGLLEGQDGQPAALRRDQVYFTKKSVDGASELYSLAEFKDEARSVHNIRKRYLAGLYGAVPMLEKMSL